MAIFAYLTSKLKTLVLHVPFPFLYISLAFFSRIHDIKWIVLQLCGQSEHLMANFSVVFAIPKLFLPGFHLRTFSALFLYQTTWNNPEMTAETWSYHALSGVDGCCLSFHAVNTYTRGCQTNTRLQWKAGSEEFWEDDKLLLSLDEKCRCCEY